MNYEIAFDINLSHKIHKCMRKTAALLLAKSQKRVIPAVHNLQPESHKQPFLSFHATHKPLA